MINRRLGVILIILAVLISVALYSFTNALYVEGEQMGCFGAPECGTIDTSLSIMHFSFGFVGFILALGVYLLFFYTGEEAILKRLEDEKNSKLKDDKFSILLKALDKNEQIILEAIKEQDGISQSTLVIRSGLSKSKVSEVLSSFEKKKLIEKRKKGKLNYIYFCGLN